MIKAYILSVKDDPDQGAVVVFDKTAKEAKKKIYSTDLIWDTWLDVRVNRAKEFDGMEKLSKTQLALKQWHMGWRWFDYNTPEPEETTDEQFIKWYENNFIKEPSHE